MQIRKAQEQDIETLSDFWYKLALKVEPYSDFNQLKDDAKERARDNLREFIDDEDYGIFVLVVDSNKSGYVFIERKDERDSRNTGDYAHIGALFVEPEYRGSGYGTKLLEKAEEWAERNDCNFMTLSSEWENEKAREFYLQNDYERKKVDFVKKLQEK